MALAHRPPVARPLLNTTTSQVASETPNEAGRDPAQLSEFQRELIAIFVDMMQTLGLPKSYGEIYGLLYATAEPLGFADIHERLALSKGSISGGLKALKEIGAVKGILSSDDRRERYEPELELRKLVLAYMKERIQPQLAANSARMETLDSLLTASTGGEGQAHKILESRLGKLAKWRHKASGLIPWIARFLA